MGKGKSLLQLLIGLLALIATPAVQAQELKPICPDRGAIQACTLDAGHLELEMSLADWVSDSSHTLLLGDTVVRLGLNDTTEIQLGISPWVHKAWGVGHSDLKLTLRHRLATGPISLAIQPMITLPVGSKKLTQGHIGAGIAMSATWDVNPNTQFYLTPYSILSSPRLVGTFIGVNQTVKGPLGANLEFMAQRQSHVDQASVDMGLTYTIGENLEFDLSSNLGINRNTPDVELVFGVSRRF